MNYVRVEWKHDRPADPVLIYGELDADQWEQRKVEVFADGHKGYADRNRKTDGTMLGLEPWPEFATIGMEPEFEVSVITKEEFELIWTAATQ